MPPMIQKLRVLLAILPVSSAECERGFSAMNRQHTKEKNKLLPSTLRYSIHRAFQSKYLCKIELLYMMT